MAAPYLRSGHPINNNPNNMYSRNGGNNSSSAYPRNRVEEANLSLMEMENNQRWVSSLTLSNSFSSTLISIFLSG